MMKTSIKREQSQAGLSFAERKNFRPKVKNKLLLLLVLLMTAATGAWATDAITVTWSSGDNYENNNSKDGVTLSGDIVEYNGEEWQLAYDKSKGTFTTELGNFTKIEITGGYVNGFSGEGWSGRTWTGNAAAVPFGGYITDDSGDQPWTITFTIEPASSAPAGYTVSLKDGVKDADKWTVKVGEGQAQALPIGGLKGDGTETVTLQYNGRLKVKGVKAVKKAPAPAEGKTYTNLKGGEVLHVGDKITETEGTFRSTHNDNPQESDYYTYLRSGKTYEVLRADVVDYKYTESPNGQYYVLKCTYFDYDDYEDWVTDYYFVQDLPVTGTSDGITVTLDGQDGYGQNLYTFWVHEPNQAAPAPVPVTYTALSGGEVLHVGDIIEIPDGQEWRINNSYIMSSRNPLTVVRANITFDQWDDLTVTEAADGAYYVIKDTGGWYYCTYEGFTLPVTGTSDGIYVTYNGILWDEYPDYTFSVHEK